MALTKDNLPNSVKEKQWSDSQVELFLATANAALANAVGEGEAIEIGIRQTEEKINAKQFPKKFYCRHMQPGIAKYENETILVDTDAIKRMMPSAIGKPVYIHHQDVDLENLKEKADGYITDSFYNELDGWAWFSFLAIDDKCYQAIALNWAVSNAYVPLEWGAGGTKNNCPYDREVMSGEFTHLAIVPDPRYEGACIMSPDEFKIYQENKKRELEELHNSKSTPKGKIMFNLFKMKKETVSSIDAETMVEIENGKSVSIGEMVEAITNAKKNSEAEDDKKKKEKEEMENADQMVECDGEKMPLKELMNRYSKLKKNEKKNESAAEESEEEEEAADKKEKKNAKEEKVEDAVTLENARVAAETAQKHFDELRNANKKVEPAATMIETSHDMMARGKARYGSDNK